MTEFQRGQIFADRYRIDGILGGGGFANVYEATDTSIGRRVALKVLRPDGAENYSSELRARFQREASTVANLQDPHTVTVFDHGESDGLLYLVFEYVAGTSLDVVIREEGPIHTRVATTIVTQILESLREAHTAGVLHRDVKPANIIIHEYMGNPHCAKLVDFGLAKPAVSSDESALTRSGLVMGTAQYTSPEAFQLQPLGPPTDIFGLGLVFYEMVVGQAAVQAASPIEIAEQMVRRPEIDVPASIPEPARSVIVGMVRKDPHQRFQSAAEVLAALEAGAATEAPAATPSGRQADLGSARTLSADDFGDSDHAPLALDESAVRRPAPDAGPQSDQSPTADRRQRTRGDRKEGRGRGGVWGFGLLLTLLLVAASYGVVSYLDLRMPWEVKPELVEPTSLPQKTFDVASDDTAFFYVDWRRGIVFASSLSEVPAAGRCALILDSRSDPTPPGAYYVVEAVDSIVQKPTAEPMGADALARRAEQCDHAASTAQGVRLSAEIIASELRIDDVEKRAAMRRQRRKRAERLGAEEVGTRRSFYDKFSSALSSDRSQTLDLTKK